MKVNKLLIWIGIGFTLFCALSQVLYPRENILEPIGFALGSWLLIGCILWWNHKHGIK